MHDTLSNRHSSHVLPIVIIIVAIVAAYGVTTTYEFVNYDDYPLIVQNTELLSHPSNIFSVFTTHAFSGTGKEGAYYRPLLIASYMFDYQLWGLTPSGYHLTNVVLHIFATIFLYLLGRLFIPNNFFALLAALLFSLHPVQVESVAWIAGRDNILLGLGIAAMIYFYILQYVNTEKKRLYLFLSILSFIIALFAKEAAIFFVLLLPLYEYSIRRIPLRTQISRTFLLRYLMFSLPLVVYLILRMSVVGGIIGLENVYGTTPIADRFTELPLVLGENFSLLFFPVHLSVQHSLAQSLWQYQPWNTLVFIVFAAFLVACWLAWKWNRFLFFTLGWLVLGFLPLMNILPIAVPIMEHRLYIAAFGITGCLSSVVYEYLYNRNHSAALVLGSILVLIVLIGTIQRVPVWKNSGTLWHDTIEKSPTSFRAHFNLAGYYYEHGEYDSTISHLQTCVKIQPDDYNGYSKLIQTYTILHQPENIVSVYRRMIIVKPHQQSRYLELGRFFEQNNLPDSAIQVYREGLNVDSTFYQLHFRLGDIHRTRHENAQAAQHYIASISIKPDYAPPYFDLAMLEAVRGNNLQAQDYFERGKKFGIPPPAIDSLMMNIDHRKK